jgi:hypothetical protein
MNIFSPPRIPFINAGHHSELESFNGSIPKSKEEKTMMKKLLTIWTIALFALSLGVFAAAQEKAKKSEEPAQVGQPAVSKPAEEPKKESKEEAKPVSLKPRIWRAGGLITAVNAQAKSLSLHQETVHHDRTLKLKVSEPVAIELPNFKVGDLVDVWITGDVVTTLKRLDR